jgi:hypothetical protein
MVCVNTDANHISAPCLVLLVVSAQAEPPRRTPHQGRFAMVDLFTNLLHIAVYYSLR